MTKKKQGRVNNFILTLGLVFETKTQTGVQTRPAKKVGKKKGSSFTKKSNDRCTDDFV